jgi:hypothetical protein
MQNDTVLMTSIFKVTSYVGAKEFTTNEDLPTFKFEIDRTGRVLKFLGLAKEAARSDLGWKPMPRLMEVVAEKMVRPTPTCKIRATNEDRNFLSSFFVRATGDALKSERSVDAFDFCCSVLAVLGLLNETADGGYKPTPCLRELILETYLQVPRRVAHA